MLACLILVALLPCCGEGGSSAEKAAKEGILLVGNNSEPQSLDPHKATAVADGKVISTLLEGLVRPDPRDEALVHPGMAERWESNEDGSVWTFHLRPARWSDGTPVTSRDFAYAYQRVLHPRFAARYAEMLYVIRNAEAYNKGACAWEDVGVETPDDHTLRLTMQGPTPHLPYLLLHYTWYPVPKHHVEAHGGMLDRRSLWTQTSQWVGNGAYLPEGHRFNDYLKVRPNPLYWRAHEVRNNGVCFFPVVNGYTETRMYAGGKLHITNNVPPEMLEMARQRFPGEFCQDPYYCTIFYRLNTTRPPLNDIRVRKALSLAVDRSDLVHLVIRGAGRAAYTFIPPGAGYCPPATETGEKLTRRQREEQARSLLAEAGFPGGKGFPALEIMTSSRDVQRLMAETIQSMWENVLGIHVEIRSCEWTAYKAAQQNMDYDISSSSWSGDYLDPATFANLWRSGGGNNCTGWGSPSCDRFLSAAAASGQNQERLGRLAEAEAEMLRGQPVIPLYWSDRTYLKSRHIDGWHPLMLDNHPLDAVEAKP